MVEKFKEFITEEKDEPYRFLNLIHDTPADPNKTGDAMEIQAKKMGIDNFMILLIEDFETITGYKLNKFLI